MKIMITAGPTREAIDPIRFISNRSSGKMGYALAQVAVNLGHQVSLISGPVNLKPPENLILFKQIISSQDMFDAVIKHYCENDLIIMCAAVADYRPIHVETQKIKKSNHELILKLERTTDILKYLGEHKRSGCVHVGFAAETENLKENAIKKLKEKNADYIIANDVSSPINGMSSDSNSVTIYRNDGDVHAIPCGLKGLIAEKILKYIFES